MKTLLTGLLALMISAPSLASRVGNGGDAIYCQKEDGTVTAELLDFYEGRTRGLTMNMDGATTVEEKINLIINRVEQHDLFLGLVIREGLEHFYANREFTEDDLIDIPDSLHIRKPKNCEVKQAAIFKMPHELLPGESAYLINQPLWDLMDNDSKAGLILHEVLYRYARNVHHSDSVATRVALSVIATKKFEDEGVEFLYPFIGNVNPPGAGIYYQVRILKQLKNPANEAELLYLYTTSWPTRKYICPHGELVSLDLLKQNEKWLVRHLELTKYDFINQPLNAKLKDGQGIARVSSQKGVEELRNGYSVSMLCVSKTKPTLADQDIGLVW